MATTPTWPGVYVDELPSPVHAIIGVSTSITAFIGTAPMGPTDEAKLIHSFSDYQRIYGGFWKNSRMSYAVSHYFLNGGTDAVIVRVVDDTASPAVFSSAEGLVLQATNPGAWANDLKIKIDNMVKPDNTGNPDPKLFNLTITSPSLGITETFRNVSCYSDNPRVLKTILYEESNLVTVKTDLPDQTPTQNPVLTTNGSDGGNPVDNNLRGMKGNGTPTLTKTGINLLDEVDFNLLCIPPFDGSDDTSSNVYSKAISYCKPRRAMVIVDPPSAWVNKDKAHDNIDNFTSPRSYNAIIYFPRIIIADPLQQNRLDTFVPCGAVAGVIAQTDANHGVWKAPAGIQAGLTGVADLTVRLTDLENGELNPLGINCLRTMPVVGTVVWGARTLRGADLLTDQWKYISIRRTAFYIEESLYRGTQWAVFEPNDEPLWSQIRLNVGSFMHDLFLKGAFQGSSPKDAYLVKCDKDTTTQDDINKGIVNIVVGFAPLYPAEFVMIHIQQLAGQQPGGA